MPFTVFISHSTKDKDIINTLFSYLKQSGINVTTSRSFNPTLRTSIQDQISQMINKVDCVLAFLTQSDKDRDSIHQEIGIARAYEKLVIPIVETGVILPDSLKRYRHIQYDKNNPWETIQNINQYALYLKTAKEQEERQRSMGIGLVALFFGLLMLATFSEEK